MIRVLVAEDSATVRELLVELMRSDPEIQVIGEAKNGVEAVAMTKRLHPDLVTMDIRMPLMDGFEATKQIMVEAPTPIVIVSASVDPHDVEVSMHALRVGALTLIGKPEGPSSPDFAEHSRRFLSVVKSMAQVRVVRRWAEPSSRPAATSPARSEPGPRARIVAIAASTGGPAALSQVLSGLPGDLPVPVLVVQHIAQGFLAGFAAWLNTNVSLRVKVAVSGEAPQPHTIYLPPDDRHLGLARDGSLLASSAPPVGGFRPSATFLFESVAAVHGAATLAVVLTGMGQDGLEGLRAVHQAGGQILAQDENTSVVFGMPGAAARAGLPDAVLPLKDIGARVLRSLRPEARP
jgi:two-component system, chemotaxis family, protein-glutamate methylesterase/glutaminase